MDWTNCSTGQSECCLEKIVCKYLQPINEFSNMKTINIEKATTYRNTKPWHMVFIIIIQIKCSWPFKIDDPEKIIGLVKSSQCQLQNLKQSIWDQLKNWSLSKLSSRSMHIGCFLNKKQNQSSKFIKMVMLPQLTRVSVRLPAQEYREEVHQSTSFCQHEI